MARRQVPSFPNLWYKHETLYVGIFITALKRLSDGQYDMSDENIISKRLCIILNTVCFEESQKNNREIRTPDWEKPIPPITEEELMEDRKRPDFTCKLTNPYAVCDNEYEIPFHIECKRLGFPTSTSWILNENYVINGVKRFDSIDHEYGKRAPSGMMVGYIINMTYRKILDEVNTYQKKHCVQNPDIEFHSAIHTVQLHRQILKRQNLKPEAFKLIHLWVDLTSTGTGP